MSGRRDSEKKLSEREALNRKGCEEKQREDREDKPSSASFAVYFVNFAVKSFCLQNLRRA
jgi:hypothetical protein